MRGFDRIVLGALVAIAAIAPMSTHATDQRLIDQSARPVDEHEISGRWLLVYFGYTSCQDICPAALTTMTQVLHRLGPRAAAINPIFITLDPEHDSPSVLRDFLSHFDPRIRGLTGSTEAVTEAARTFQVPWKNGSPAAVSDHGTLLYVVAPDGRVVQLLHPQQPLEDLVSAIVTRISTSER